MKILHVGQMIGGVYNKENNDYIIVCGDEDKHNPVMRDSKPVREYHISLYRSLNPFKDLKVLLQTVKINKKEKPDVIHCHSAKGGVIGRTAGWLTHTRTCYTPHAFSYLCTPSNLKRKIYLVIEKLTKFKTFVLACSESEQQMAKKEVGYDERHALVWTMLSPTHHWNKASRLIWIFLMRVTLAAPAIKRTYYFYWTLSRKPRTEDAA